MGQGPNPRDVYIQIATRMFAKHGYHGASLADLAREAGVSKQALLHFFRKKDALYAAVLEDLAARLIAGFDAAHHPKPVRHLHRYFAKFLDDALDDPQDVQLIIRALLESDAAARNWPLRPFLDKILARASETAGGQARGEGALLGWLTQVLGTIQYAAISRTAITAMYDTEAAEAAQHHAAEGVSDTVKALMQV